MIKSLFKSLLNSKKDKAAAKQSALIPATPELDISASKWHNGSILIPNDVKEELKSDYHPLNTEPIESKSGLMSQISIRQFEQRRIIEDYMH